MSGDTALQAAISHLETYGYCVLPNRMPRPDVESLAERCLSLHADPACKEYITGDEGYQTLFGMLNLNARVWDYATHPDVLAIAQHFLGPGIRVVEAASKPTWPGAPAQGLHVDSASDFLEVPDVPWMINTIWMLTDFTEANGATGVVPISHRSRLKRPPAEVSEEGWLIQPVTGEAGSVVLWHGGLFHQARANRSDQVRVGLNIAYYPRWFNNWVEGGHQPVWPETFERMPPEMQALCPGKRGRSRQSVYEEA